MTAPASVLIVEDERIIAKDLQLTLRHLGYDAFAIASSAEEAVAVATERCPDIALMDIRISGRRDGIETAQILRTRFGVPVVYLTAHADAETLERAKTTEPQAYLIKPVKAAELRGAIELALLKVQMERRLRERERWLSTTLRSIADAVVIADLAGKVTFMNPAAELLTGCPIATALGKPAAEVLRLMKTSEAMVDTPLETALRLNEAIELHEMDLLNQTTGASRLIDDSAAPVVDDGKTLGAVMVFRDVTEQRKLQRQLELSDRLASLGTMAAGVAHEVNNPLAVVLANAAVALDEVSRLRRDVMEGAPLQAQVVRVDTVLEVLRDVQSAGVRIERIVSDLRQFSRPTSQRGTGVVDLVRCVEWVVRTTAHELRHRARLVTRLGAVPPIGGDDARLGQVIMNLVMNAAHSIPTGRAAENEVRVTTRSVGDRVILEVQDTGAGMSKEVLARAFEPFFTTKAQGTGTGLGLSICHGIVISLGGEISVESQPGLGTTVRVSLPAVAPQEPVVGSATAVAAGQLRGRILVIDDEEMVLRAMRRILGAHDVVGTTSVDEGLAILRSGQLFDLVISDVMMPNMTGIDLYEHLLVMDPDLARRLVFLTGGAVTTKVDDFLRSVGNPRVEKPFEVSAFLGLVQQLLANK